MYQTWWSKRLKLNGLWKWRVLKKWTFQTFKKGLNEQFAKFVGSKIKRGTVQKSKTGRCLMMKMDVSWRKASRRSFYFLLLIYFERIFHTWIWYCRFSSQILLSDKIMVLSFIDIPMYAIECFWHISVDIIPCFCLLVLITRLSLVNKVSRWNYISRSDYPKIISSLLNPYSSKNYVKYI